VPGLVDAVFMPEYSHAPKISGNQFPPGQKEESQGACAPEPSAKQTERYYRLGNFPIKQHISYKTAYFPLWISSQQQLSPPDQSVSDKEKDGSENRSDEPGRLALSVPTEVLSDVGRDNGPGDAEENRNDKSARISSRHEQLGYSPNYKTDHNRPQDMHAASLR
jgi:hypothetical protein